MTEKENFLRVIHGEVPEWVPRFGLGPDPYATKPPAVIHPNTSFMWQGFTPEGGHDIFGVEYQTTKETGGMALPKPGKFILTDIRKWRDVIKVPDISHIDFAAMAKKDIEGTKQDPEKVAVVLGTHVGYFQQLMNFMGFTEGLCALCEEPDECMELFDYMGTFYENYYRKCMDHYKPDILHIFDDTATAQNSFISIDVFRKLIKPFHVRLAKIGIERGIPIMMHNCGRCEDFIDDWFDYGVTSWNPAQVMNDLDGIKKKYGNKICLIGCWDSQGPAGMDDASEELIRKSVRDCIDRFSAGGGFCFWGSVYGPPDDPSVINRRRWMTQEYEAYREKPYK
jgi:hypothetical protein